MASGETLWRIAATLAQNGTVTGIAGDTYSYLLAIVDDNRPLMGNGILYTMLAGDALQTEAFTVLEDLLKQCPDYPAPAAIQRQLLALAKQLGRAEEAAQYEQALGISASTSSTNQNHAH